jgi:hypothetical protein
MRKLIPYAVVLWILVMINSIIVWGSISAAVRVVAFGGMVASTLALKNQLRITNKNLLLFFVTLVLYVWISYKKMHNVGMFAAYFMNYIPLLLIYFWPKTYLLKSYLLFRKLIIIVSIFASIISILILLGQASWLPYYVMPAQSGLHQGLGYVYYVYGFIVTINDPSQSQLFRACGFLQEPGHFSIFLGFVYMIDRFIKQKQNWWVIICGILTFSGNFLLFVLFTEIKVIVDNFLNHKLNVNKYLNYLKYVTIVGSVGFILYVILPRSITDQFYYTLYERNLEKVFDAYQESGSLEGALDERVNDYGEFEYEHATTQEMIWGKVRRDAEVVLSDYRGLILNLGIIGMSMIALLTLVIIRRESWGVKIAVASSVLLIVIHRSWMCLAPYPYFFPFWAAALSTISIKNVSKKRKRVMPRISAGKTFYRNNNDTYTNHIKQSL